MDFSISLPPGAPPATDVVSRKVFVNGAELGGEVLLSQLSVNKSFNKIAFAKLIFLDGSASERDFPLSNEDKFKPGSEIKIQLGYHGEVETVFEGIIVKHSIKVKENGLSFLIIEAKDKAIKLAGARKSKYFIDKTDSEILTELAGELKKDIDSTSYSNKQIVQFESTDWDFIVTRAEVNSMLVLTDDGKLIIKKPTTSSEPVTTATYGQNIWEFDGELDARRQFKTVSGHSWNYTKQEIENSDDGTATFSENGNLSSDDVGKVIGAEVNLNHTGYLEQQQLQNWANAYELRNKISKAVGRVRIQGNASVKPGTMITLEGVGDRFNGKVFVTGVLHNYGSNWLTDVQFGWKEEWFYKKEDVMEKPAAGLLPGINGLQIGVVKDVDDKESGGQYRVKVHIPTIKSGNEGIWARVATLDAGSDRGVYFRPQTGDEVVLGFLNDDPRNAIILGCLHSKDSKKSPLPETESQLEYGFVTKEKIKLIFDDTNKKLTLSVPSGKTITINDASGAMELKDENKNSIKMDSSGITIEAGLGNVTIKGTLVNIN